MRFLYPLSSLRQPLFARLYAAQAISLLGDSVTWLGIALLAWEFGGEHSSGILATALTLRVSAYVLLGSWSGMLADRHSRKKIMILANTGRMIAVLSLVFITSVWQLYTVIFLLNVLNAFFSPAFKASIPQVVNGKENYAPAISLANATWQLLGIAGPGIAGIMAAEWGARQIFLADALTFVVSTAILFFIPLSSPPRDNNPVFSTREIIRDTAEGTRLVFGSPPIRFALMAELTAAIAGAQVLVNTIGHVKGPLGLGDSQYGFVMSAFGAGATIAAFTASTADRSKDRRVILAAGSGLLASAVTIAGLAPYNWLIVLWVFAGAGLSFADMPSQMLIAENISPENQGKAYGSHFAWTHLWWATGYILAGITGSALHRYAFAAGGLASLAILAVLIIRMKRRA